MVKKNFWIKIYVQYNNIIIGKYLLSWFYYKDIILHEKQLNELNLKSVKKGDPIAQYRLGYYYQYGVVQDHKKAVEWYSRSANNGCAKA